MNNKLLQIMVMSAYAIEAERLRRYYNKPSFPSPPLPTAKPKPIQLHTFKIKGVEIKARSKKDAIKRYNHLKKKRI